MPSFYKWKNPPMNYTSLLEKHHKELEIDKFVNKKIKY